MTTPPTISLVWHEVVRSLRVLADRDAQVCVATGTIMTILSLALSPHRTPGIGTWIFLLLIGAVIVLATTSYVASRNPAADSSERQFRRTAALTLSVSGLVFNAMLSIASTLFLGVGLFITLRQTSRTRPGMFPWTIGALLVTLVPWWIWSAVDSWDAGLLLLAPLAILAWVAESHFRAGMNDETTSHPALSDRGHRFAAWMAMLSGGLLVVLAGLVAHEQRSWLALGGIAMIFAVAGEAGAPSPGTSPGKYSPVISNIAFAFLIICWLAAIQ